MFSGTSHSRRSAEPSKTSCGVLRSIVSIMGRSGVRRFSTAEARRAQRALSGRRCLPHFSTGRGVRRLEFCSTGGRSCVSPVGGPPCAFFSSLPKYKFAHWVKPLSLQVFSSVSVRQLYSNCLTSAEALSYNGLCDSSESLQYNGSSTHSFREMLQQACLYVCDKFDSAADGMT